MVLQRCSIRLDTCGALKGSSPFVRDSVWQEDSNPALYSDSLNTEEEFSSKYLRREKKINKKVKKTNTFTHKKPTKALAMYINSEIRTLYVNIYHLFAILYVVSK